MNYRSILLSDILACPHAILLPEHYRENGTCLCDETQCEHTNFIGRCKNKKYKKEIYCKHHVIALYNVTHLDDEE